MIRSKKSARGGPIQSGKKVSGVGKAYSAQTGPMSDRKGLGPIRSGRAPAKLAIKQPAMHGRVHGAGHGMGAITGGKTMSNPLARAFSAPNAGMPERKVIGKRGGVV
jgi:hypothetical protein